MQDAIRAANVHEFTERFEDGINTLIGERGVKLSGGQRQRITIARAIIANPRILILDEATANVDVKTDRFIQKTIRKEFSDCTIITIAHRLHTIIDYDKVLVLHEGRIVEYDSPETLMKDRSTLFYSMLQNSGMITS